MSCFGDFGHFGILTTLWLCQNYRKWSFYSFFTYETWWFSTAMLVYQRVSLLFKKYMLEMISPIVGRCETLGHFAFPNPWPLPPPKWDTRGLITKNVHLDSQPQLGHVNKIGSGCHHAPKPWRNLKLAKAYCSVYIITSFSEYVYGPGHKSKDILMYSSLKISNPSVWKSTWTLELK